MKRTLLWAMLSSLAWSLPEGAQIQSGQVQLSSPESHILQVLQASPSAILNWNSFSIQAGQLVQFLQPNGQAVALNRVVGTDPSLILGQLQANGRLFLLNPNGILFGPNSSVSAGSFLASTLNMSDSDFLAGNYRLQATPGQTLSGISHQGEIRVDPQGFVVLLSPLLDHQGAIVAQQGQVVLGATTQATLALDAQGHLSVVMPDGFRGTSSGAQGAVLMSSAQASESLAQVVQSPILEAAQLVPQGSGFLLEGGEGVLVHSGRIEGASQVLLNSSQATVLAPGSSIRAQEGARVDALSAGRTWSGGEIVARNGFVEISAPQIGFHSNVDVGASGTLLLDPSDIIISNGTDSPFANPFFNDSGTALTLNAVTLGNQAGAINIVADGDVRVDPGVIVNFNNPVSLVITAGNNTAVGGLLMGNGSALRASDATSTIRINGNNATVLGEISFNTITAQLTGPQELFLQGNLGRSGADTTINLGANNLSTVTGATVNVLGNRATVNVTAGNNFVFNPNSQLLLPQGTTEILTGGDITFLANSQLRQQGQGDVTLRAPRINVLPGSSIEARNLNMTATVGNVDLDPGFTGQTSLRSNSSDGRLNLTSFNGFVRTNELQFNNVNINAGENVTIGGDIGRSGAPSNINVTATNPISGQVLLTTERTVNVLGTSASLNIQSQVFNPAQDSRLVFQAPGNLNINAGRATLGQNATIESNQPLTLTYRGSRFDASTGTINLTAPGSLLDVQTTPGAILLANVTVDRAELQSAANVRLFGQVRANNFNLQAGGLIIGQSPDTELIINQGGVLSATQIVGNLSDPSRGLDQALTISGNELTNLDIYVSGGNFTDPTPPSNGDPVRPLGVAGSLYYRHPQSPNLRVFRGDSAGEVRIVSEPRPAIQDKSDLTATEIATINSEIAQNQLQLGNIPPQPLLLNDCNDLSLAEPNPGLVSFALTNLSSGLLEGPILSPGDHLEAISANLLLTQDDNEKDDVRFWRKLIERVIVWEQD